MNVVVLVGRLTRDPELKFGQSGKAYSRFSLAVDRPFSKGEADFINCVAFGRQAEFAEKYFHKGIRIVITGRIQTGSYTNKDGVRVYTTDIIVEEQEFAESKAASDRNSSDFAANNNYGGGYQQSGRPVPSQAPSDGFMNIPDGIDEELPFS